MIRHRNEDGFTLIEIMTTMAILAILLAISVVGLRHFWLKRSLRSSADAAMTQLRSAQEKVTSESFPIVYGVRFDPGTNDWFQIRFDPVNTGTGDDTCSTMETNEFDTGIIIDSASFEEDSYRTSFCRSRLGAPGDSQIAFFYSRGSATNGEVTLKQTSLDISSTLEVDPTTGRVTKQ